MVLAAIACGGTGDGPSGDGTSAGDGTTAASMTGSADDASTGDDADVTGTDSGEPFSGRLVVTADFTAGTLSLLDHAALVAGASTRDEMLVGTIDLSAWAPGPLQIEIAPDGHTAVVSVSPGFFDGFVGGLIDAGTLASDGRLLIVDLVAREVIAELAPAHAPMGIAISPDGTVAYTANYGLADAPGDTLSVIDLAARQVVDDIVVGNRPEQVALSDDGTLGILNLAGDGTVRVFQTVDPAGTLSQPLLVSDDPSDVAFIPGTSLACVSNSIGPSSFSIIDVSDPLLPVLVETAPPPGGIPYALSLVPGTTDIILVSTDLTLINVFRIDVTATPASIVWSHTETALNGFPLSAAIDPDAGIVLVDVPGDDQLLVVDLDAGRAHAIAWPGPTAPTYVAIAPP